ncbi:MAG: hypothetical protein PHV55_07170 [Candidatus Omnitrophica bacterium]|nr:hypothetical protein [Candidatus Omnitrophota bacterium]
MKKLTLTVLLLIFPFVCFAEEPVPANTSNSTVTERIENFTGKVDSVSDWSTTTKSKIVVRDDKGLHSTFVVAADTEIIGKDGDPTTLDWAKGNKVAIRYTVNRESVKTAKSIKVLTD